MGYKDSQPSRKPLPGAPPPLCHPPPHPDLWNEALAAPPPLSGLCCWLETQPPLCGLRMER